MARCSVDIPTPRTKQRNEICERYGYKCVYCGRKFKDSFEDWMLLTVEHVIPYKELKKEGNHRENDMENKRCACRTCNNMSTRLVAGFEKLRFEERIKKVLNKKKRDILKRREKFRQFYDECVNPK